MTRPVFSNLCIGHLNVRGLEHHIDGVKLLLDNNKYHIFAVTETKLRSSAPMGPIRVPAFNFVKHSLPTDRGRGTKSCGGVGFYVSKGLKATPVIKSSLDPALPIAARVEYLVVKVAINELNIGVCVVYNPSGSNQYFSQCYEKLLIEMLDFGFDRIYMVGDFNINVSAALATTNLSALNRINDTFNLTVLPTGPTRITDTSTSTIDLLITDCPQFIRKSKAVTANISDHEIVFLLTDIRFQKTPPQVIRVRNFRNIDTLRLQGDFQEIDWQEYYESTDVNTKTTIMSTKLERLLQVHAPEKTIVVHDKRTPWITPEIKRAVELKELAFKLYSRNPNRRKGDPQWQDFTRKRDRASSLISAAKKRYAELHFDHNLPAKKLWCNLRREGIHNNTKQCSPSADADVEVLNEFFSEGHFQLQDRNGNALGEPSHRTAIDHGAVGFSFRNTNVAEVSRKVFEIQTNAAGNDSIPISFVKSLCPFILPVLCHLFNEIIRTQSFPALWKTAIVTPIPKTSNPTQPKDYRPISVLPTISKVFEKMLLSQICDYLDDSDHQLLAHNQSGYRKGFSTTTALAKVIHDVYENFDENRCTVMVLVDFSLAFNCVDHRILRNKLNEEFRFSRTACDLVSSFLANRRQTVRVGNSQSNVREVKDGTPQGSCLSALLFMLYINSLPAVLKCNYHLYADDLQIYISGPIADVNLLIQTINEDLIAISRWAKQNSLHPNPKKTQSIIFTKTGSIVPQADIVFDGVVITPSNKVTNLGVQLDNNLTWSHQVNSVVQKVYNTLRTFRRFAAVLATPTRHKLVQGVIVPIFTYCDIVYYHGLSAALKLQLHRCFKSAVRFVYNLRRRDSTIPVRNNILGHDLPTNYYIRTCCFMKQAYDSNLPAYLQNHFTRGQQERTRSFIIPRHTTSSGKSLLVAGTSHWNNLPPDVKQKPSSTTFKSAVKRFARN